MDNTTRLQYLEVMEIESWYPKTHAETSAKPISTLIKVKPKPSLVAKEIVKPVLESAVILKTQDSWELLEQELKFCQNCELAKTRTQVVLGVGNKNADWMFIGEDPDEYEDLQGLPFVNNVGLLFIEMLRALGLKTEQVFMTNILKCRPPEDRPPKVKELAACHNHFTRQKALIKPKIIVAVGRVAAQQLLKTKQPLKELRGIVHQFDNTPLVVIYHPAYLLRSLIQKRATWQDLQFALKTYQTL